MAGGHAWQGACVTGRMHGRGLMYGRGCVHGRGACMACTPPSRYYEIWSMSGQYASYWNAFLLMYKALPLSIRSVRLRTLYTELGVNV